MARDGELNYLRNQGPVGLAHAKYKPFSDNNCPELLASISAIMGLMPPPPAKVLDLGCGTGWTSVLFAKRGYDVTGQDVAPDMIAAANELKSEERIGGNLRFVVSDYESLALQPEFDCAIFFDSLHHSEDEYSAIKCAYDALRPGGILITHEPGVGHANSEESQRAMALYGVNERDMPPSLIIKQGKKIGFRGHRIYPIPRNATCLFYGPKTSPIQRLARIALLMLPRPNSSAITVLTK